MPPGASSKHVALLRGINVGGKNKVPMKQLVALFEEAGCTDVSTYIQSGNVIFNANAALVRRLPELITASLLENLGVDAPVLIRSGSELRKVLQNNPFLRHKSAATEHLHVGFLTKAPTRSQAGALDPDRSPGDTFEVKGSEIYLCCPNGVARTKLTVTWFDKILGTTTTVRNWRTVQKLAELAGTT
jgi:uncharacterized protein (DUF1697 family)